MKMKNKERINDLLLGPFLGKKTFLSEIEYERKYKPCQSGWGNA
jgi:hypothetical protein